MRTRREHRKPAISFFNRSATASGSAFAPSCRGKRRLLLFVFAKFPADNPHFLAQIMLFLVFFYFIMQLLRDL
jgi:hypothetical protein